MPSIPWIVRKVYPTVEIQQGVGGSCIRVYGFLFYDTEHEDAAFTTCNKCGHIWRKTNWEIHPITQIDIIEEE